MRRASLLYPWRGWMACYEESSDGAVAFSFAVGRQGWMDAEQELCNSFCPYHNGAVCFQILATSLFSTGLYWKYHGTAADNSSTQEPCRPKVRSRFRHCVATP